MRALVFWSLVLLTACNGNIPAEHNENIVVAEVAAQFESLSEAARLLDNEAYFKHFDPNRFVALNADGTVVHSFDEFKKNYLQGVQGLSGYEELKFDKVKISVIDNKNALLVNEYSASLRLRDGQTVSVKGAGTQVWHKMDSEWKLVSVSSSTYSK